MSLWIKICGNTSLNDAQLAVDAGADALGFVFAPSSRQVTPGEAAAIVRRLPPAVEKIGVFVDAAAEEIYSTVRACGLTGVQLHFEAPPELPAKLHARLGAALHILAVVHMESGGAKGIKAQLAEYAGNPHVGGVLVDSRVAGFSGGTGVPFDWAAARRKYFHTAKARERLVVAGGLNPENVAEAIQALRPWGVDVVTGVEAAPGRKDAAKVREFLARARAVPEKPGRRSVQ